MNSLRRARSAVPLILIVEDNEMNADMLSRRLRRKGYNVVVAADGESGVRNAQQLRPHLVLMDLTLPVMDGWTATRKIRADPLIGKTPVIALTAHAIAGDREKALAAGCNDYDTKPVEWHRLLRKMEALLG